MSKLEVIIPTIHCTNFDTGNEYIEDLMDSIEKTGDKDNIDIHLIENEKSFHEAVNRGFRETKGDVVVLNDDVLLSKHFFTKLSRGYGDIRGCKVLDTDGVIMHVGGTLSSGDFHGAHLGYMSLDTGQYVAHTPTPFVTFAGVYIRREVINEIGGMSDQYGRIYFDDVDYCLRAWKAGFWVVYNPVSMVHFESATMKQQKANVREIYLKGLEVFKKNWLNDETRKMLRERMSGWEAYYFNEIDKHRAQA